MLRSCRFIVASLVVILTLAPRASAQKALTVEQFLAPAWPMELVSAKKAERIAWISYDRGERNVYTAAAPDFRAVPVTRFKGDNGVDLTMLRLSDDGTVVVFVRGHTPNRQGWIANPTSDPNGAERAIWAARTAGGAAWRLSEGTDPALSPDGRWVLFVKDGQIYRVPATQAARTTPTDKAEKPFIRALVARRDEDRLRERAGRSQLHRGLRPAHACGLVSRAGGRPGHEPDLVTRQ